ncbi:MAG: hypothetical protein H0U78_01405 [Rickettsiaceae bacterium]|nr:hypothetical protein [Rickettsiaceae bacterium]
MKLSGASKDQIIDFLELSDRMPDLKNIYCKLLIHNLFLRKLKEIKYLLNSQQYHCSIINQSPNKDNQLLIEKSLKDAGIIISETNTNNIISLYIQDKELNVYPIKSESVIYIIFNLENPIKIQTAHEYINFTHNTDYELNILKLLLKITQKSEINTIINTFNRESQNINDGFFNSAISTPKPTKSLFKNKKIISAVVIALIFFITILVYTTNYLRPPKVLKVTSGDPLPNNFYLERNSILNKMDELLGIPNSINAVALVGIGGAGKTILAQQYATNHSVSIVWKLNAETPESTLTSLECLAYDLCETETDKADFYEIQKITNLFKREYMIFSFLKHRALKHKDWILIYDNVTNFSDIQKYLPRTLEDWGPGKVIITTTNSNIINNNYFAKENIIYVLQLDDHESLKLFNTILDKNNTNDENQNETRLFLKNIPPFPLDITQAAYYIKNTGTEYAKYLQYITSEDQNFTNAQKSILAAITNYTKTRGYIIELSLKKIIDSHKDLDKLLLLSSILNAENIPKDLFIACHGDIATYNFINEMQKFSLITENNDNLVNVFSIHPSIQSIMFNYVHKRIPTEYYNNIISALENYMENELVLNKDPKKIQALSVHLESLLAHDHLFSKESVFTIQNILGNYYYKAFNDIEKAKSLLEHARMVALQYDKSPRINLVKNSLYLGEIYNELGSFQEAEKLKSSYK